MTSSKMKKNFRLDVDLVEKCRQESNFKRLRDILPQIYVNKSGAGLEILANFLSGECFLENFLSENAVKPDVSNKELLKKTKTYFQAVLSSDHQNSTTIEEKFKFLNLHSETHLLMAKLYFLCAQYDECLNSISKAKLDIDQDPPSEIKSLRILHLIAESYALKAFCYEIGESPLASKFQKKTKNDQILAFYEKCADLTIKFLTNLDAYFTGSSSGQYSAAAAQISTSSTTAVQASGGGPQNSLTAGGSGGQASSSAAINNPTSPTPTSSTFNNRQMIVDQLGPFLQTALQKVPLEYLKRQQIAKAIDFYRILILHCDRPYLQNLQQILCRQLAQLLLRNVAGKFYQAPFSASGDVKIGLGARNEPNFGVENLNSASESASFRPGHRIEEAFLLLNVSDSLACKEAVLSRAEEHQEAREKSLNAVKCVQNLLTIALISVRQFTSLADVFDRSMKFAYEDHFVWLQFSLALINQRRYGRASIVLKESLPENEIFERGDELKFLLVAKLCVEQLGFFDQGLEMCQKVLAMRPAPGPPFLSRAHLLAGSALSLKAQCCPVYQEKRQLSRRALEHYRTASELDPRDHCADFLLALQLACAGRLDEASEVCRRSMRKRPEQPGAILLMALLLTTRNLYSQALNLVEEALQDFPTNYGLLVLRLKLEMKLEKAGRALITAKDLLIFWRIETFSPHPDRILPLPDGSSPLNFDQNFNIQQNDLETSSQRQISIAADVPSGGGGGGSSLAGFAAQFDDKESLFSSATAAAGRPLTEYGGAVSTVSESLGLTASNVYKDLFTQYRMQSNIWLELAELFLSAPNDQYVEEVQDCVDEACVQFPNSHQVLYLRGRLHEKAGRWQQAKACYNASLALFPTHLPSWRRLAQVYDSCARERMINGDAQSLRSADERMAERTWRRLIQTEPTDHRAWRSLGHLLARRRDYPQAVRCLKTAVALEQTTPLMPFAVVPRVLHL